MKPPRPLTTDQLFEELQKVYRKMQEDGETGFTTSQLVDALGVSRATAQEMLRRWVHDGFVRFCGKRRITRVDGVSSLAPAYHFVKPPTPGTLPEGRSMSISNPDSGRVKASGG